MLYTCQGIATNRLWKALWIILTWVARSAERQCPRTVISHVIKYNLQDKILTVINTTVLMSKEKSWFIVLVWRLLPIISPRKQYLEVLREAGCTVLVAGVLKNERHVSWIARSINWHDQRLMKTLEQQCLTCSLFRHQNSNLPRMMLASRWVICWPLQVKLYFTLSTTFWQVFVVVLYSGSGAAVYPLSQSHLGTYSS